MLRQNYPSKSKLFLWQSLLIHMFLCVLFGILNSFYSSQTVIAVPSLRVDLVALPDQVKSDPRLRQAVRTAIAEIKQKTPQIENEPETKVDENQNIPTLKTEEKKQKINKNFDTNFEIPKKRAQSFKKEQALDRIRGLLQKEDRLKEQKEQAQEKLKDFIAKGNSLSLGSSLKGSLQEQAELRYSDRIRDELHAYFNLPLYLERRKELRAKITLYINAEGRIKKIHFDESSGDSQFDHFVEKSIEAAQPFSLPPAEIIGELLQTGLSFSFPL